MLDGRRPDRPQSLGDDRKQQVLGGGGAILHPIAGVFFERRVAADQDPDRRLKRHARVGVKAGDSVEHGAVADDDEMPRLLVPRGRGGHGGLEEFRDVRFTHRLGGVLSDAATAMDPLKRHVFLHGKATSIA